MKKSTKAALFSALIFPGAGLYLLKHYWRGSIFFIPALLAIAYIFSGFTKVTAEFRTKVQMDPNIVLDVSRLSADIATSLHSHIPFYHQAFSLFIISWIVSTVSSYFAGKKQELADAHAVNTTEL